MSTLVNYTTSETVAVITVNNPPVNALSPGVPEGIEAALQKATSDPAIHSVVIVGAGRTFIAGADITLLQDMAWGKIQAEANLHNLVTAIEDSSKPVVMAIHGTALGGGLEVAMAGHYRVAVPSAQFGQPEVNLGLIPGAEGTQRLPRLVGVEKALEMCIGGKLISASEALSAGLIEHIVQEDLVAASIAFAKTAAPNVKTRDRYQLLGTSETNAPLFAAALQLALKTRRHQQAPLKAIEAIEAATTLPFREGCARERHLFNALIVSDQARALIHAFFAERAAAKVPGIDKGTRTLPIERVAVIGAGTMGTGITMTCINAGLPVILRDANSQALDTGLSRIRANYETSIKRGRFTEQEVDQRLSLVHPQLDSEGLGQVDLIIEAVFENLALKKQVLQELDAIAKPGCILATNTSTLNVDEMAAVTSRPESVVGMHFFSPANVMRLLEIVRGPKTSPEVVATALAVAKLLKKVGVVVGNCPGFVGNRMFFPYMYEAQFLVDDGATPEQVDRALTDFGMAMGVFAVDDLAGIDVAWRVRQELGHFTQPGARKPLVQDLLYTLGRYGQKTGKGWYVYGEDRKPASDPDVLALIESAAKAAGLVKRHVSDREIVDRLLFILINEGARILQEGFALRSSDIDVIYLNGYGFPSWRGGPMCFADLTGLATVLAATEFFHREFGDRWAPAPLLVKLAAEGRTFRDYDKTR